MENLQAAIAAIISIRDKTVLEPFAIPFEPVTIRREMKTFRTHLGLRPGVAAAPDPEFIVRLVSGERSTAAMFRRQVGEQFKNFENFIRGRHEPTPTTRKLMADACGCKPDELDVWKHGNEDGPLLPMLVSGFQIVEGFPARCMTAVMQTEIPCPCCGHNALDDIDLFWEGSGLALCKPEYDFAERLLNAIVGGYGIYDALRSLFLPLPERLALTQLAVPKRRPVGHWLDELRADLGADDLADLATKMQIRHDGDLSFTHKRMGKWSCEDDLIPPDALEALLSVTSDPVYFRIRHVAARTLSMVVDFILAAVDEPDEPSRDEIQEVVHRRLERLGDNVRLAFGVHRSRKHSEDLSSQAHARPTPAP